ncbi:MAG: hypothetical protein WEA58_06520 [Balneolaceae bacterium]
MIKIPETALIIQYRGMKRGISYSGWLCKKWIFFDFIRTIARMNRDSSEV